MKKNKKKKKEKDGKKGRKIDEMLTSSDIDLRELNPTTSKPTAKSRNSKNISKNR